MGHSDNMVTLVGIAPGEVYDLLGPSDPSGQGEHNFPADWQKLGLIDRAWIGLPGSGKRDRQAAVAPVDDEDDDWPMDLWIGL